jgi:hypothetical protein
MHPLPEAVKRVWAPCALWLSHQVWQRVTRLLFGAMLVSGVRTLTAVCRVIGRARERHCTHDHRVLHRAT